MTWNTGPASAGITGRHTWNPQFLNCGFRETVVRRVFPFVSMAYFDFTSARAIVDYAAECVRLASTCFGNRKKLHAIVHGASLVASVGIAELWAQLTSDRRALLSLPFIGGVTAMHLLKNLGADVAKNDRHLARLSVELGFSDASALCTFISTRTGEPASAVDIVLWRHCTLTAYV